MIFWVTPSSSRKARLGGWMVAARWSRTGAGSCSHTVTGTPRRLSASAHTMPTGPAPTTRTRGLSAMTRLLHLEPEVAHHIAPARRLGGNDGGEFLGCLEHRLDADLEQPFAELGGVLRCRDLAPD